MPKRFAVVTGASSWIGAALAQVCACEGFHLLLAGNGGTVWQVAERCRGAGGTVEGLELDLATAAGVERLYAATKGRTVDALLANAGHGLGDGFLEGDRTAAHHGVDTNIVGTTDLIQRVVNDMCSRKGGRILITASSGGFSRSTFQAANCCTNALIDSFSSALREKLADTGVSVTCMVPGATDTELWARAQTFGSRVGLAGEDDPNAVARIGFDAMMRGDGNVAEPLSVRRSGRYS